MIEQIDQRLTNWIQSVVGDVTVSFSPPNEDKQAAGVNLYLLEMVDSPPASGSQTAPLQFALRYLVTTWAEDSAESHRLLSELTFAALSDSEMDIAIGSISAETWLTLNAPTQPAFVITEIVRKPRPEPAIKYVRQPLVIETHPTATLVGRVQGPGAIPITGARIECPSLSRSTYSDTKGHFTFPNMPSDRPVRLTVRAKGRKRTIDVKQPTSKDAPVLVEFEFD